jgi:hypothetical protein
MIHANGTVIRQSGDVKATSLCGGWRGFFLPHARGAKDAKEEIEIQVIGTEAACA